MNCQGKIAIVTGASSGIGKSTATLLSQNGATVVLASRSKKILEKLSADLKNSVAIQVDTRDPQSIRNLINTTMKKFGRIDILVNNAGRGYDSFVEHIHLKLFQELFDLNLRGPLLMMQGVIPIMRTQGGGVIVNISSGTSLMTIPNIAAYASLKRALNSLSLTAREELAPDHIFVSVVYPYITATNFAKNILGGARKRQPQEEDSDLPPADPPELVAEKILEAITTGKAEIVVHPWMEKMLSTGR